MHVHRGSGCRDCGYARNGARKATPAVGRSFADLRPALAEGWHHSLNGDLSPADFCVSSGQSAWWYCAVHEVAYEQTFQVRARSRGNGCAECARDATRNVAGAPPRRVPPPGESLSEKYPELVTEWDSVRNGDLRPDQFMSGSRSVVWWLCPEGCESYELMINRRTGRGAGCQPCAFKRRGRIRATPKEGGSAAAAYPSLVEDWHPTLNRGLTLSDFKAGSAHRAWWHCSTCERDYEQPINARTSGAGCRDCGLQSTAAHKARPQEGQSLADLHPEISDEWHPTKNGALRPSSFKPGSHASVWWLCAECKHEYQASVGNRARGSGCRPCGSERTRLALMVPIAGESFGDRRPDLAAEWHPTLNQDRTPYDFKPRSGQKAWWTCAVCPQPYEAPIFHRAAGTGCPDCSPGEASEQERRIYRALVDTFPAAENTVSIPNPAGRPFRVDIYCPAQGFIVEFDGSYWHGPKSPAGDRSVADAVKANALRQMGYKVIRIREGDLVPLHDHDIRVPYKADPADVAGAVVERLAALGIVPSVAAQ